MLQRFCFENETEAGCDEAGRGCLAGPVFAAAVILPHHFFHPLLDDSKKLTEDNRYELRPIIQKEALAWAVGQISPRIIDRVNILQASILAMHKALDQLVVRPTMVLVDGNRFKKYRRLAYHCIIKGDATYASIAAASILAKTYRDDYMFQLHNEFPHYNWKQNKGYPTPFHRKMIAEHGTTFHHRLTFRMQKEKQLQGTIFSEASTD